MQHILLYQPSACCCPCPMSPQSRLFVSHLEMCRSPVLCSVWCYIWSRASICNGAFFQIIGGCHRVAVAAVHGCERPSGCLSRPGTLRRRGGALAGGAQVGGRGVPAGGVRGAHSSRGAWIPLPGRRLGPAPHDPGGLHRPPCGGRAPAPAGAACHFGERNYITHI